MPIAEKKRGFIVNRKKIMAVVASVAAVASLAACGVKDEAAPAADSSTITKTMSWTAADGSAQLPPGCVQVGSGSLGQNLPGENHVVAVHKVQHGFSPSGARSRPGSARD